jgi:hypothetical protein
MKLEKYLVSIICISFILAIIIYFVNDKNEDSLFIHVSGGFSGSLIGALFTKNELKEKLKKYLRIFELILFLVFFNVLVILNFYPNIMKLLYFS